MWPNFIVSSAGMYLGAVWLGFAPRVRRPSDIRVIVAILAFVAVYFASGVFVDHPRALLWGFVGAWLLRLVFEPDRGSIAAFSLLLAVGGCVVEGALTLTGEFSYSAPEWFHVPLWLAGLYLHGAFATLYLARRIEGGYGRLGS